MSLFREYLLGYLVWVVMLTFLVSMLGCSILILHLPRVALIHVAGEDEPLTLTMPLLLRAVSLYWLRDYMLSRHTV